jgi:hypothetical protein
MSRLHPLKKVAAGLLGLTVCAGLVLPLTGLAGETITLKNGKTLKGTIAAWNGNRTGVYFQPDDRYLKSQWISLNDIKHLQLDSVSVDQQRLVKPANAGKDDTQKPGMQKPLK